MSSKKKIPITFATYRLGNANFVQMKVKYLQNVNKQLLPVSIKEEFEKLDYEIISGIIADDPNDEPDNREFLIDRKLHEKLEGLFNDQKLLTTLHFNYEFEDDDFTKTIMLAFEKIKISKWTNVYKVKDELGLFYMLNSFYKPGFIDGYNIEIETENEVMNTCYRRFEGVDKYNMVIDDYFSQFNFEVVGINYLYELGKQEGEFIKGWDIILNNLKIYEKWFSEKENLIGYETIQDWSESKGTEKVIYLHELGILNYLRNKQPFIQSTNSLATVLSAITGEKTETLQSYLNPINNPSVKQDNNPLKNTKNLNKVKKSLENIGFNLDEG